MAETETVPGTEIEVVENGNGGTLNLFGTTDPDIVITEATLRANALSKVIREKQLFKQIGGKAHVYVEGWTLLGSMLGVFAAEEGEATPVEVEGVVGFKATVCAITRDGDIVGRATAFCMRDEPNWKTREIHALAGMAQTRATSRALRMPLGFIMKLAGYDHLPAEEVRDAADVATTLPLPADKQKFEQPKGARGRKS